MRYFRKTLLGLLIGLCGLAPCLAQTDNTFYVKNFAGTTVGAKVANALVGCNQTIPCYLILDPTLASWATGTIGTLPSYAVLVDYRTGVPWSAAGTSLKNCDDDVTSLLTFTCSPTDTLGVAAVAFSSSDTTHNSSWMLTYWGANPASSPTSSQVQIGIYHNPGTAGLKVDFGNGQPISYLATATGPLTSISTSLDYGVWKMPRNGVLETMTAIAATFTCSTNPTIELLDCQTTAGSCSGSSAMATVTLTAANAQVDTSSFTSTALLAGHYYVYRFTAGACTVLNLSVSSGFHT